MLLSPRQINLAMLLVLAVIWSTSFPLMKLAVQTIPPASVAASRLVLGSAILLVVMWARQERLPGDRRAWIGMAGVGLFGNTIPFVLATWGQRHIDAGVGAILIAFMPLGTVLIAHYILPEEPLNLRRLAGVLVGLAGIVTLVGPDALAQFGTNVLGELATLAAACSFAVSAVLARKFPPPSATVGGVGSMLAGIVFCIPLVAIADLPWTYAPTAVSIWATVGLAVLPGALAALLYFAIISRAGAGYLAMTNYLVPVLGVGWGVLALSEQVEGNAMIALVLILSGIALARRKGA